MKKVFFLLLVFISSYSYGMTKINFSNHVIPQYEEMSNRIYSAICKQAHYLISQTRVYENCPDMRLLTKSIHGEHGIRPNTGTIMGLSFLYRFGNYDAKTVGIEKSALLNQYIIPMMNYVTATYDSIPTADGKCWNKQWQSAHWAYSLGKAAWYIGDDLPVRLKNEICHIVKSEAQRFYDVEPPHRVKFDTASEENAWNSQIFHVASLLMPNDPDYAKWQELFRKWVLSSYVTMKDIESNKIVDGFKISNFKGPNIYDDYTLENHGMVHPDYMCAFILSLQTAIDYKMTNREVPEFLFYNIAPIYDNLKWFSLPDGGLTYPAWQDWRLFRNPDWVINHIYMSVFAHDKDAMHYAKDAFNCLELMQKRNPNGNIYGEKEYLFPSTQNDIILYLAQAWQTLHYAQNITDNYTPKRGIKSFENGKIILNKSNAFLHSLSYGNRIMFLPTINGKDRVFDSYQGSGIGKIKLKGDKQYLSVKLKDINIKTTKNSYHVKMCILHGDAIEAHYRIDAYNNKLEVYEELQAVQNCNVESISTSEFGILNNQSWIREKGYRNISYNNKTVQCKSTSGSIYEMKTKTLKIDNILFQLISQNKDFNTKYTGTKNYINARATDVLSLNYSNKEKSYTKGEVISNFHYTVKIDK